MAVSTSVLYDLVGVIRVCSHHYHTSMLIPLSYQYTCIRVCSYHYELLSVMPLSAPVVGHSSVGTSCRAFSCFLLTFLATNTLALLHKLSTWPEQKDEKAYTLPMKERIPYRSYHPCLSNHPYECQGNRMCARRASEKMFCKEPIENMGCEEALCVCVCVCV